MNNNLVSIIMPAYNAATYIADAIESVLHQTHPLWELLIINDGSKDKTEEILKSFLSDKRIQYFKQENKGVSAARNVGLANMRGNYLCFLDADDVLPPESLSSRLKIFQTNSEIKFVDGVVEKKDCKLKHMDSAYRPSFVVANPLSDLVRLTGQSFFGLSWMIRCDPCEQFKFQGGLTHAEDLLFYISLARKGGLYSYTNDIIYHYRNGPKSAMSNLEGLEKGYWQVYKTMKNWREITWKDKLIFKIKVKKIMFLSYLFLQHDILKAFQVLAK